MNNAIGNIDRRISQRSYDHRVVDDSVKSKLQSYFEQYNRGPFGGTVRFMLLNLDEVGKEEVRKLGTYGVIRGAKLFILTAVTNQKGCMEDLGYCMEKVILEATALGLGTCWLGGTFRRSSFAARMALADNELLPVVSPVGYPAEKPTLIDRVMRAGAGSRKRKPWAELFFAGTPDAPLTEEKAGDYRVVLEAVRRAPSASNRQPWRIIRDEAGVFHLYLAENKRYNRALGDIRFQNMDMGIAMSHFELAACELGLKGSWVVTGSGQVFPDLEYIATYKQS